MLRAWRVSHALGFRDTLLGKVVLGERQEAGGALGNSIFTTGAKGHGGGQGPGWGLPDGECVEEADE